MLKIIKQILYMSVLLINVNFFFLFSIVKLHEANRI